MSTITQRIQRFLLSSTPTIAVGFWLFFALSRTLAQIPGPPPSAPPAMPIAQMAKDLGVTPDRLRAAFQKVHAAPQGQEPSEAQRREDRRVLSKNLGVPPERLDAVMDKYRPGGRDGGRPAQAHSARPHPDPQDEDHGRPVALVARDLGVTPAQFRAAFRKVHPAGAGQEPTQAQRRANRKILAETLGVSPERLDAVMDKYRPGGRGTNGPDSP